MSNFVFEDSKYFFDSTMIGYSDINPLDINKKLVSVYTSELTGKKSLKATKVIIEREAITKYIYDELEEYTIRSSKYGKLFRFKENGRWGILTDSGKIVLNNDYEFISCIYSPWTLAIGFKKDSFDILDFNGEIVQNAELKFNCITTWKKTLKDFDQHDRENFYPTLGKEFYPYAEFFRLVDKLSDFILNYKQERV